VRELAKPSIDVGIVVADKTSALRFWCEVIGLEHVATLPVPGDDVTIDVLACGTSTIKLLSSPHPPQVVNPPGGPHAARGLRYVTLTVSDLDAVVQRCADAGAPVPVPPSEPAPGFRFAMVEDADGNWIELLQRG